MLALVVRGIDRHGQLISAFLSQLASNQLLQHFRKKGLFQVNRLEADPTNITRSLGSCGKQRRHVPYKRGRRPLHFKGVPGEGLILPVHPFHKRLAIHTKPPTEHYGQAFMLFTESSSSICCGWERNRKPFPASKRNTWANHGSLDKMRSSFLRFPTPCRHPETGKDPSLLPSSRKPSG